MINQIILYSGVKEYLFFSYINKFYKTKLNLFFPNYFCSPPYYTRCIPKINELSEKKSDERLLAALKNIEFEATNIFANILCIGLFTLRSMSYHYSYAFRNLFDACKNIFPNASIIVVYDNSLRDDIIFEHFYSYYNFRFSHFNWVVSTGKLYRDNCFSEFIRYLVINLKDQNVSFMSIHDAATLFGIDTYTSDWINTYKPFCFPILQREVLSFAHATLACNTFQIFPDTIIHWPSQLSHFINSEYPSSLNSILGPIRRNELLEARRHDNEKAAQLSRLLGITCVYDEPQPEPDWQDFCGLDDATAFNIAKQLDLEFAHARMKELDALPVHFMNRDQRIVRQALHDVCDQTAKPLPSFISTTQTPRLSVLTLAYNHADFIAQNIESVIAQEVNFPLQHIIADDGSTDGTQQIILDYAARYHHIVPVLRKERNKPGWNNVQVLFDMCRTEYAALCDGDDYFSDPTKLQVQVDFLDKNKNCALCFHLVKVMYEDGSNRVGIYPPVDQLPRGIKPFYYLSDLVKWNIIQTNSVMYRWRFRRGLPWWFRNDCCPGDWYWHLLHAEQGKIGFINKVMSVYRRHKKGVYYLSEIDRIKHRAIVGSDELKLYDIINKHFDYRYESIILDLTNGVFADCLMYDTYRKEDKDYKPILSVISDKYPYFAKNFIKSLKFINIANQN